MVPRTPTFFQATEVAALQQMSQDLASLVAAYPTTIAEDEALLARLAQHPPAAVEQQADIMPSRLQSAVVYRLQRKRLVQFQIDR